MTVNFDHHRKDRTGIPEAILAEPKTVKDLLLAIQRSLEKSDTVLVTRLVGQQFSSVIDYVAQNSLFHTVDPYSRTMVISTRDWNAKEKKSQVAILSGGTSDQPIVEEILLSLQYFGVAAKAFSDIGVAGIHRHKPVLQEIEEDNTYKVVIVVAGNEGALFSVVSAQTKLPVIAVPTSIGYGFGGKGVAALQSALQACSPGVVAVNIDNGFGAAAFAKKLISTLDD